MKILAIRGRNLASLAGDFELDLQAPPFDRAGLFAITGPVGAGKSTLLDAACLALFDRTPRLTGRGGAAVGSPHDEEALRIGANDVRTVLRRGAVEGHAEVDFLGGDGKRYRARWSVRRARQRAAGRLQQQQLALWDLNGECLLSGGRKQETLAAIQDKLGLSFEQFCRSVVLAQGDFTAFLKSDAKDRAELLERMTGTEIYRRISQSAHERHREEERQLKVLQETASACKPLEESEHARLEKRVMRTAREVEKLGRRRATLEKACDWHATLGQLEEQETLAKKSHAKAKLAWTSTAEERQQLGLIQSAQPLRPMLESMHRSRGELSRAQEHHTECARDLNDVRLEEMKLAEASESADSELKKVEAEERKLAPELEQARELDILLAEAQKALQPVEQQSESASRALADVSVRMEKMRTELGETGGRDSGDGDSGDGDGAGHDAETVSLTLRRRRCTQKREMLQRARQTASDIRDLSSSTSELRARVEEARSQSDAAALQARTLSSALQSVSAGLEEARRALRSAEAARSLMDHRAELREGEPCPLCGSTHHPLAHETFQDILAEQGKRVSELEGEHEAISGKLIRSRAAQTSWAERAEIAVRDLARSTDRLEKLRDEWKLPRQSNGNIPEDPLDEGVADALERSIRSATRSIAELELEQERAETLQELRRLDSIRTERAMLRDTLGEQLARRMSHLRQIEESRAALLGGRPTKDVEVELSNKLSKARTGAASSAQTWKRAQVKHAEAMVRFQHAAQNREKLRAAVEEAEGRLQCAAESAEIPLQDLEARLQHDRAWIRAREREVAARKQDLERIETILMEREARRREHATGRPAVGADEARKALTEAKASHTRASEELANLRVELARDNDARERLAELEPEIKAQAEALDTWHALNQLIGSARGDRFGVFAQSLTLDALLARANHFLNELARRYRLERIPGTDLELQVVDQEMGEAVRSVHSLSGGEGFLVSLSMALGLSSLSARRTRIETLFIDEGLGTLDPVSLEAALSALDALQATGCQVGIISHVEGLAERIGVHVEIVAQGGGRSRLHTPV